MSITEITSADPMRSALNRGLMVAWINADLIERAACDVRRSVVLYDADGMFVHAMQTDVTRKAFADRLGVLSDQLTAAGVAFWSVGVK